MPILPYPAKDKGFYCNILQAKSIPSFISLNLTYLRASPHRLHKILGSITLTILNQFTLSSSLATQNALSGHLRALLPSIMSRNSSCVSFISHKHCLSILLCSSVNSLLSIMLIILQLPPTPSLLKRGESVNQVSGRISPHPLLQDCDIVIASPFRAGRVQSLDKARQGLRLLR